MQSHCGMAKKTFAKQLIKLVPGGKGFDVGPKDQTPVLNSARALEEAGMIQGKVCTRKNKSGGFYVFALPA